MFTEMNMVVTNSNVYIHNPACLQIHFVDISTDMLPAIVCIIYISPVTPSYLNFDFSRSLEGKFNGTDSRNMIPVRL